MKAGIDVVRTYFKRLGVQTGSLKRSVIRGYLAKKGIVFSFSGFFFLMKKRWKLFLDRINDEEQYA